MKKIIFALASIVVLASCDDSLERLPVDQLVPETAFRTLDDLESNLLGVYDAYPTFSELAVNSIATDNTRIGVDNGGQRIQLYNLNINASGGDQGIYDDYSVLSNRASRVIDNAVFVEVDETVPAQVARRNNILGQAYALRAFAHFKLFEYFTPNYTDQAGLSVPYVDFVAGSSDNPARETVANFTLKFNADLQQAQDLLADNNGIDRVTKNFVTFMRARHALVTGDNPGAITFAQAIINDPNTRLATGQEYVDMFSDLNNNEVIFKRVYTQADGGRIAGVWFFTGTGGYIMEVSTSLEQIIDRVNDPFRAQVLIEDGATTRPFGVGKYPGSEGVQYLNDMKEMRVSEAYLIKAEALARLNRLDEAEDEVQAIRDVRLVSSPVINYANQAEALNDILAERRLEFAFEGHRYKDLKRFGKGFTRNAADCGGASPCTLDADDFRFTLPFPLTEVQNNSGITENNRGY